MTLRINGSTSGYAEIDSPAVGGNNTIVLPSGNGSANQLLKNGATAGTLEYASVTASGTALGTVTSINNGPLAGMRNAIINGNFDIWQRGTSFASPGNAAYAADRWEVQFNNTGATRTISRQSFPLGQTDVPGEPTYFLRFDQSVAGSGGNFTQLDQRIEGVRTFAGQQVTISFWAKAAANTTMPGVILQQFFGSGGSPSNLIGTVAASNVALTTAWQKFSYQTSLPSISGKTLGTNNNDALIVVFDMPLNATFTIDIAQVQVEPGPIATQFERRPIGMELSLCQRYFQYADGYMGGYVTGSVTATYRSTALVQMRATPAVVVFSSENTGCTNSTITAIGTGHWQFTCLATGAFIGRAAASLSAEL